MAAPAGAPMPLDSYTANLWGAYSVNKLRSTAGSAFRIRRSSDNAEQDIGFSGSSADGTAAASFAGAGSAFIRSLLDQSGNSNHFGQSTLANQPRIVNAGAYDGKLIFDGSNDGLVSSTTSGSVSALTIYIRGGLRALTTLQVFFEQSTDFGANLDTVAAYYDNGIGRVTAYINRSPPANTNNYTAYLNNNLHAYVFDPSQTTTSKIRQYVNGALQAPDSSPNAGSNEGTLASFNYYLGARNGGASFPSSLDLESLVIYTAPHDAAMVAAISALL